MDFKHKRTWLIILAILGVILAPGLVTFVYTRSEMNAARQLGATFVGDMSSADGAAAYQLLSPSTQRKVSNASIVGYASQMNKILVQSPAEDSWKINLGIIGPEQATVNYSAPGHKGNGSIALTLEKTNGKWTVRNFSIDIH